MIDKIKLMNDNFNPDFIKKSLKWTDYVIEDEPFKKAQQAMLFNRFLDGRTSMGLGVLLTENLKTKTYSISIEGSIRKWYYKDNSRKDLNYLEFVHCIELIGEKLGLKKSEIWKMFKISVLEVGVTLLLKAYFHGILKCFVRYRNAERDIKYETSLYFKFNNYDILFYDKFIEINKGKIWTTKDQNIFNKFHFLRFEISVTKVSGTTFKNKFDTLELLKNNWNELPIVLENYLEKIEFIDLLSQKKEIASNSHSEYINYLIYKGIESEGLIETIANHGKIKIPSNKSKKLKNLIDIYKSNINNERDYKGELLNELKKKTSRLYNKSHIRYEFNT